MERKTVAIWRIIALKGLYFIFILVMEIPIATKVPSIGRASNNL